jgi:hypothetical protein
MARNKSYYMSSWITSEYADHEALEVVKHIAEVLQKTSTRCYKARIKPQDAESSIALQSLASQLTSQSFGGSPLGHTNLP